MKLQLPRYAQELFRPHRYKVLYGGRGSAKSYSIARALLTIGKQKKIRVLCARELQNSIKESVHHLLKQEIAALGLSHFYHVTESSIVGINGTEFIFKGIRFNTDSLKSMAGITHVWLEEADRISQSSWDFLIPTIREPGSEIWVSFNPADDDDPTYVMFVNPETNEPLDRDDAFICKVNWQENPWFPEVLSKEKDRLYLIDANKAIHVWEGETRKNHEAQIFNGKFEVRDFEPAEDFDGPYLGADWGFSVDPTTATANYIHETIDERGNPYRELLIRWETGAVGVELDDIPELFEKIPVIHDRLIRADSARPETISYVGRKGFNIEGVDKWAGSVEDGIEWMRSFNKIVIHPDCVHTIKEFRKYSYKVDRLTGDVTTDVVDSWNHYIDSIRYACAPMIQVSLQGILSVL